MEAGRNVALVTVAEGPGVQADVAFLAGALRRRDLFPVEVPTDFCTDEEPFQAALHALHPAAVVFPYQPEFREIVQHLSAEARRALEVPVAVTGDALLREPMQPTLADGVLVLPGDLGPGLVDCLSGADPREPDHAHTSADLHYGAGSSAPDEPIKGSLFLELETIPLWAARTARDSLPPTAMLARLEAPAGVAAIPLEPAVALAPLDGMGATVQRVEWWDRHADETVLARAAELKVRHVLQSARFLVDGHDPAELEALSGVGIDRVIFELDRVADAEPASRSNACARELLPFVEHARLLGLEIGILAVIGVPGENAANGEDRLEGLRALRPDHLRCVPFEPTDGDPSGGRRWNRELHRCLEGDGEEAEVFITNWARAHDLLAEVETRGGQQP